MTVSVEVKISNDCCGGPAALSNLKACCIEDEAAKASGGKGCGCSDKSVASSKKNECCCLS